MRRQQELGEEERGEGCEKAELAARREKRRGEEEDRAARSDAEWRGAICVCVLSGWCTLEAAGFFCVAGGYFDPAAGLKSKTRPTSRPGSHRIFTGGPNEGRAQLLQTKRRRRGPELLFYEQQRSPCCTVSQAVFQAREEIRWSLSKQVEHPRAWQSSASWDRGE
ncbi:hypothetical protein Micbo1qcDRAFT_58020 [Microdochium bolleyi]|uniref:Uncharacterized protein n=1 Tax=Microdochium bolleyi TaxID=196109 RepID=A0A136J3U4_9PEZI|nr:hypothetical protein Micbo1qcDRAFT_58020 [Microdochium bolleyi]